jgi:hypothetical protein
VARERWLALRSFVGMIDQGFGLGPRLTFVGAGGCDLADPRLAAERRALVASYAALLDSVSRVPA